MKDFFVKVKEFCSDNKKYVGVAAVLLCLIILLAVVTANGKKDKKENTEVTEQTQVSVEDFQFETEYTDDKKDEITQLLQNYYTAYVSADLDTLANIAYPMTDNEKSYIGVVSQYYETVSDITVYSKAGLENGSYFVSVENNIKFYGVDTVAPTLDFFYIATDDYINNVYSNFNRTYAEEELDSGIVSLISKYTSDSDFANLQESVQSKYDEAVNSDANLKEMLETTLTGAIKQWYTTVRVDNSTQTTEQSTEQTTEQSSQQQADDQAATDQSSQATDQNAQNAQNTDQAAQNTTDQSAQNTTDQTAQNTADQSAQNTTDQAAQDTQPSEYAVQTTDVVNVRAIADPNGKLLGKLTEGVKLTAYGTYGEWTKISYSGSENGVGFIKTELLKTVE